MIEAKGNKAKLTGTTYDIMQEFQAVVQGMRKLIEETTEPAWNLAILSKDLPLWRLVDKASTYGR